MSNNLTKAGAKPVDMLKSILKADSVQEQFTNAMGAHKDAFVASLIDLYTGDVSLQSCKPQAVVMEALRAATMKLPINKALGFAYIVVYNNSVRMPDGSLQKQPTPTFITGYKGYIQLALRTGQYKTINADLVYEGEISGYNKLAGTIEFDGKRTSDKVIGYFAYIEMLNGFSKTLYMSVEDMASYALRYAPSFKGRNKPSVESLVKTAQKNEPSTKVGWEGNFNDMALKTVIRRLISKYGYMSVEMQNAVIADVNSESAQAIRNDDIADTEVEEIDVDAVEDVTSSTGYIGVTSSEEVAHEKDFVSKTPKAEETAPADEEDAPY